MYLTKSSTPVIGWVAAVLGFIMNGIFIAQSAIHLENIGLCIILFTIVIYLLMTPLTIQQQKFSKLQSRMSPEIQAIQKKYGSTKDQAQMQKMNEETQAVYAKYGVNPMGSCVQLLIQMPILFALYRVIWNIPAYVDKVKAVFIPLADELLKVEGAEETMSEIAKSVATSFPSMSQNTLIDVLYKFRPQSWTTLSEKFPDLSSIIETTRTGIDKMNYFLGLNIADSPMNIMKNAFTDRKFLILFAAVMIPVLAAVTQWLNTKLMTSGQDMEAQQGGAADTMKTMNNIMPLMSAVFCLTLPVGMGIYWIAGAVVRSIQQVVINKHLDKMDVDELVKANLEKLNAKRIKEGLPPEKMNANAHMATRNIDNGTSLRAAPRRDLQKKAQMEAGSSAAAQSGSADAAGGDASSKAKPGSLASKAGMVARYNATHTKK